MSGKSFALAILIACVASASPRAWADDPAATQASSDMQEDAAAKEARENSLASTMQTIRSMVELYKIQHSDHHPTLCQMADWQALKAKSDASGKTSDAGQFGPYLQKAPVNPFTGKSAVTGSGSATKDDGWTWDEKTGTLRAVIPADVRKNHPKLCDEDIEVLK